jgi:hypothetical protein
MDENPYGAGGWGDPCRQCGYVWSIPEGDALGVIAEAPAAFADLLAGRNGTGTADGLTWDARTYVWHVADNLRIWAERLSGLAPGERRPVAPYDQDALAAVRHYDGMPLAAALWSLGRSSAEFVGQWSAAPPDAALLHPEAGELGMGPVLRQVAHDTVHHQYDVSRTG